MDSTTDTAAMPEGPMNDDTAVDWLLSPESEETETPEAQETPDAETDADDREDVDEDAPDEAENTDEDSEDADSDEDEEDGNDEEDDSEESEPLYDVKVDGQERKVTLQDLKNDFAGRASLENRHVNLKEQEQKLSAAFEGVASERQVLMQMYQQVNSTGFIPAPKPPARELLDQDPIAYMEADADYRSNLQAYEQQQQQMQYLRQRDEQVNQQRLQQHLQSEMEKLTGLIPEFGDAEKAPKLKERLVKNAGSHYGYTPDEVENVNDARAIAVLNDAIAYRELKAGKQAAKQPREQANAVTKPKGKAAVGKRQQAQKQMQKAQRTQSDEDWVNVLLNP